MYITGTTEYWRQRTGIKASKESKEYFKINSFEELHEESKPKIDLLDTKDELNNQLCPRCRKPIEDSRFKLSGKYICRDCRNIIRDKMILDIYNKKGDLKWK